MSELALAGSRGFNDIQRGVPLMSSSLLPRRAAARAAGTSSDPCSEALQRVPRTVSPVRSRARPAPGPLERAMAQRPDFAERRTTPRLFTWRDVSARSGCSTTSGRLRPFKGAAGAVGDLRRRGGRLYDLDRPRSPTRSPFRGRLLRRHVRRPPSCRSTPHAAWATCAPGSPTSTSTTACARRRAAGARPA